MKTKEAGISKPIYQPSPPTNEKGKKTTPAFKLTSSPTLILLPPHPGNNTRSPSFTETGTTSPVFEEGAPGPTAMTVASGMVVVVDEEGMKRPEAVF